LWAYEFEAGKFIAGEILGGTLYMYAPTGRGEKWVMNSEGVVLEYSSEPFHKRDEIIAGINAHYGTSFYQEDDIDKDFTIGETMPNWNAYEKIELPIRDKDYIKIMDGPTVYAIGYLENNKFHVYGNNSETYINVNNSGMVTSINSRLIDIISYWESIGIDEVISEIGVYEINSNIPNWDWYNEYQ
jgi:hypothetical protein